LKCDVAGAASIALASVELRKSLRTHGMRQIVEKTDAHREEQGKKSRAPKGVTDPSSREQGRTLLQDEKVGLAGEKVKASRESKTSRLMHEGEKKQLKDTAKGVAKEVRQSRIG